MLAARADGKRIVTLEGMQEEAKEFGAFMANEGAEQCGFCNPGFIMNVFAMLKELEDPTEEDILEYLSGNLCRCSGFVGQTRSILKFLDYKKGQEEGKRNKQEIQIGTDMKQTAEEAAKRHKKHICVYI